MDMWMPHLRLMKLFVKEDFIYLTLTGIQIFSDLLVRYVGSLIKEEKLILMFS